MSEEAKSSVRAWGEWTMEQAHVRRKIEARMGPMPPYSGPTTCPKCGATAVGTRFCHRWDAGCRSVEHIHRDCARCGHTWCEAPLDAEAIP